MDNFISANDTNIRFISLRLADNFHTRCRYKAPAGITGEVPQCIKTNQACDIIINIIIQDNTCEK